MVLLKEETLEKESAATLEELRAAKEELEKLKEKVLNKQNEFSRQGYEQYIASARSLRLNPSGNSPGVLSSLFSRLSGNSKSSVEELELWGIPDVVDYERAARLAITQVQGVINDLTNPDRIFLRSSIPVHDNDPSLVSIQKIVKIPPKLMLLTHIRADLKGEADDYLIYMKEHLTYPKERSFLFHIISTYPRAMLLTPRDYLLMTTWAADEDSPDTLWLASRSLKNNRILGQPSGCIRGIMKMYGMKLEPIELQHNSDYGSVIGTKVTLIYSTDLRVWLPWPSYKSQLHAMLEEIIDGCEEVGLNLMDINKHSQMIDRFIDNPTPSKARFTSLNGLKNELQEMPSNKETQDGELKENPKSAPAPVVISDKINPPKIEGELDELKPYDSGDENETEEEKRPKKQKKQSRKRGKNRKKQKMKEEEESDQISEDDQVHLERVVSTKQKDETDTYTASSDSYLSSSKPNYDKRLKYTIVEESDSDSDESETTSGSESDFEYETEKRYESYGNREEEDPLEFDEELDDLLDNYHLYKGRVMDSTPYS